MAEQVEDGAKSAESHGGLGHSVFSYSLSDAICRVGIPTLDIGLSAAKVGLVKTGMGEGTLHFEWDKERLDKLPVKTLEALLVGLRAATGGVYAR